MYKVSVIISCYKNEEDIEKAIESCANQTLQEIEVIVVNDGSPDNSQEIINRMMEKYPDKVFGYLKENGGIASVRNFGISKVHGEYFGFLDGDDYIEPDMFEKLYNKAKEEDSNFCCGGFYFTYKDHEDPFIEGPYYTSNEMMLNLHAVLWNKIYKTSFIRDLNIPFIEGYRYEDVSFLYKVAPYIHHFSFVEQPLVHYVQREGSSMASHNHKVKEVVYIWEDLYQYYKNKNIFDQYYEELEYLSVKFMLGQPFRSAVKIKDKADRKKTLEMLYSTLHKNFPNWKSNRILKERKDMKHLYFRSVNALTYPVFSFIFKWL